MQTLANLTTLGAPLTKRRDSDLDNQRNLVRGRCLSHRRRSSAQVAAAGRRESRSLFRTCTVGRANAASKILGTPRRNEPRPPLATEGFDTRDLKEAKVCWRSWPHKARASSDDALQLWSRAIITRNTNDERLSRPGLILIAGA